MDIEKLIEQLSARGLRNGSSLGYHSGLFDEAATALSTLQAENKAMQKQLNEFSEFLCRMTGGLLSKTNYTAQVMATIAEDHQQKACRECNLQAENEKLRAELEQVTQERDAVKSPEVLEAVDELMEFARARMSTGNWLYYVEVLGEWRGQKED